MTDGKMRLLDLFSGIGGFSLGLERSGGFKTVAFCEIDPFCRKVLNKHWPDVPIYEDVCSLTAERLQADGVAVDAICGGFPCQDISVAGKGAGLAGERSGLWKEYARLIGELRPRFIFVENVAALLGRGIGDVLGDMAALGYDAEWHCIPASYIGAPHRRDRIWIISYPSQKRCGEAWGFQRGRFAEWISRCREEVMSSDFRQERNEGRKPQEVSGLSAFSWCKNVRRVEDLLGRSDLPPPLFRGTRDGVPDWVGRVGACGNAVVPQIPELIGRAVLASIKSQEAA